MQEFRPSNSQRLLALAASCWLCTLIHSGAAYAGERMFYVNAPVPPMFPAALDAVPPAHISSSIFTPPPLTVAAPPPNFTAPPFSETSNYSATEFRPRKSTLFDPLPAVVSVGETPMLRGTTVWQRMSDYKSRDRVRLLTLWETSGSTVSLQAGKHGDPSLQWTSRWMNRGGSTRGLLDQFFSVSLVGAGASLLTAAHFRSDSQQQNSNKQISQSPISATAK